MLFIKVENNNTVNHPVTIENLRLIYQNFDVNNPPDGYLPFTRASVPVQTDVYTVYESNYVVSDNNVSEVYITRTMTQEEKQLLFTKMEQYKPYPSWILNEETCNWEPPTSYPSDENKYNWDEGSGSWVIHST